MEQDAKQHITKIEQTVEYLKTKRLNDPKLDERKRGYIVKDIEAMEFLLEYAKEALVQRGVRV